MSKHTNKVHGKLNFLMIAVVVVIGAVSYLLVQSGTIDPTLGTSSGIKGVKKADKYVSKNDVVVELDGEEIQDVLNNPDFQRMIASGEFQKLASDEEGKVIESFGVWVEKKMYGRTYMGIERSTFIISNNKKILEIYRKVKVKNHANLVLERSKELI